MNEKIHESCPQDSDDDDENEFGEYVIEIVDEITRKMIFKDDYESNVFFCEVTNLLSKFLPKIKCVGCKENLTARDYEISVNKLFTLREKNNPDPESNQNQPSHALWKFFMQMEFVFKRLCEKIPPDNKDFEEIFIISADKLLFSNEHCFKSTSIIISMFIKERLKLKLHQYMPHKRLQYASKSIK